MIDQKLEKLEIPLPFSHSIAHPTPSSLAHPSVSYLPLSGLSVYHPTRIPSATMTTTTITLDSIPYHTTLQLPSPSSIAPHPPTAPLITLSHALMASPAMWDPLLPPLLNAGYRVLTYAHPGHSPSGPPPTSMQNFIHFDTLTSHLASIIRHHNAACFAPVRADPAAHPDVNSTTLDDEDVVAAGAPGLTSLPHAQGLWDERIALFEKDLEQGTEELVEQTVGRWLPGDEERSVEAREVAKGMTRGCAIEGYRACAGGIGGYDYTEELGNVTARTLVVVGSRDGAVGERGVNEDVARRTGGRFVWLDGAGHLPPIHMPEEFGRLVVEFLEEEG
ncbi:hypothetical protein KVT40_002611 [Elsinoe batatas]|uniref:AB hydrolase-1 domain-containing protein n=1 Tax=Elsinoe batatas TaxID=2601811 RepID=A0A8K0L6Q8_9PEZI|nr:hypothetical protein KVT40_002611 [Elsinoe batatas]